MSSYIVGDTSFNTCILMCGYQLRFLLWIIEKNECLLSFDEQCWYAVLHLKKSWKNYKAKVNLSSSTNPWRLVAVDRAAKWVQDMISEADRGLGGTGL